MSNRIPKSIAFQDVTIGSGRMAEHGLTVTVCGRGTLNRGDEFWSGTVTFRIGQREMIAGLERGVIGMRVGGTRRIRFGPHLGYGDTTVPGVPARAVLKFEITLQSVADS
jgi:peptidylprolyl isomerase